MRRRLPFLLTPDGYLVGLLVFIGGSISILFLSPATKPGVIEALVSAVYGLLAGLVMGRVYTREVRLLAEGEGEWWLAPLGLLRPHPAYLAVVLGALAAHHTLRALALVVPGSGSVWSHLTAQSVQEPLAGGGPFYFLAWMATLSIIGTRAYYSVPE